MERRAASAELDGRSIAFELAVSSRARWIRAELQLHRGLRVVVPRGQGEAQALDFLFRRRRWLFRALDRMRRLEARVPDRRLEDGARLPFLGGELLLRVSLGPSEVVRDGGGLRVRAPRRVPGVLRRLLQAWYAEEAARRFEAWTRDLAASHGLRYRRVRISDARRRWGSCSPTGTLSFHWKLMLAPEPVGRYLVAHELAHLDVKNHSKRFWARVGELCPGYAEQERWLRRFGVGLAL
jgi:predicted metal-dependent hydrolase